MAHRDTQHPTILNSVLRLNCSKPPASPAPKAEGRFVPERGEKRVLAGSVTVCGPLFSPSLFSMRLSLFCQLAPLPDRRIGQPLFCRVSLFCSVFTHFLTSSPTRLRCEPVSLQAAFFWGFSVSLGDRASGPDLGPGTVPSAFCAGSLSPCPGCFGPGLALWFLVPPVTRSPSFSRLFLL